MVYALPPLRFGSLEMDLHSTQASLGREKAALIQETSRTLDPVWRKLREHGIQTKLFGMMDPADDDKFFPDLLTVQIRDVFRKDTGGQPVVTYKPLNMYGKDGLKVALSALIDSIEALAARVRTSQPYAASPLTSTGFTGVLGLEDMPAPIRASRPRLGIFDDGTLPPTEDSPEAIAKSRPAPPPSSTGPLFHSPHSRRFLRPQNSAGLQVHRDHPPSGDAD